MGSWRSRWYGTESIGSTHIRAFIIFPIMPMSLELFKAKLKLYRTRI